MISLRRLAAALMVLMVVGVSLFYADGGRWFRVETPSLGTLAPVGTLVITRPVSPSALEAGDLIAFQPPNSTRTYTHLIRRVEPDGTLRTGGRISGEDPWVLSPERVHGRAVIRIPALGAVLGMGGVLLPGISALALILSRLRRRELALPVALVGVAGLIALCCTVYQPLTGAQQLGVTSTAELTRVRYVATGLVPVELHSGPHRLRLEPGEEGELVVADTRRSGRRVEHRLTVQADLGWPAWAAIVGLCFAPALGGAVRRRLARGHADPLTAPARPIVGSGAGEPWELGEPGEWGKPPQSRPGGPGGQHHPGRHRPPRKILLNRA